MQPTIPMIIAKRIVVCTICGILSVSLRPILLATNKFAPMARPVETDTISATISVFVPTAASASVLPKRPTMAVSAALKKLLQHAAQGNRNGKEE